MSTIRPCALTVQGAKAKDKAEGAKYSGDSRRHLLLACGFFNEVSMTPASDMAPSMLNVTSLPVGTIPLACVPLKERPNLTGYAS